MRLNNRQTAGSFLRQLWEQRGGGWEFELRLIGNGPTRQSFHTTIASLLDAADQAEGQNVYFGVAPRLAGRGSRKDGIASVTALWADLDRDIEPREAAKLCANYPVKPSCVIRSGHGYHIYWLLEEAVGPERFAEVERCNRHIAEVIGADGACADVTRVLRLPGSVNVKSEPHKPCVGLFDEQARFSRSSFEIHAGLAPRDLPVCPRDTETRTCDWQAAREGERNTACFQLAAKLQRVGIPEGITLAALHAWNWKNEPPLPSGEVCDTVRGVYRRGLAVDTTPASGCWTAAELVTLHNDPVEWVIEGLIPLRGVTMFSGEGGIGKSFFALDLAMAVATGQPFAEVFPARHGPVLYVDLENDEGTIGRRAGQLALGRGVDGAKLPIFIPKRGKPGVELQMDTPEGRAWLWGAICEHKPVLVVIDSLIAAHSGDENNNVAMRQLMAGLDGMARDGDLGLVVVHHQRKRGVVNDAGQLMRGASDLRNAIVSHLAARRYGDDVILVEHDKCRPARPRDPFSLRLVDEEDESAVRVELVGVGDGARPGADAATTREKLILQRLAQGPTRSGELIKELGYPERTCYRSLSQLQKKGLIVKTVDGLYQLKGDLRN